MGVPRCCASLNSLEEVMPVTYGEVGESPLHASLRPVVAAIDQEMSRFAGGTQLETKTRIRELLESWTRLVELLALGPAPQMRECPVCKHGGMLAATRCGFCWTTLSSLAHSEDEQSSTRKAPRRQS
jgi:hypothetical protein